MYIYWSSVYKQQKTENVHKDGTSWRNSIPSIRVLHCRKKKNMESVYYHEEIFRIDITKVKKMKVDKSIYRILFFFFFFLGRMVWLAGSPSPNHWTAKKFPIVCYFLRQGRLRETKWVKVCVCVCARACMHVRFCVHVCICLYVCACTTKPHYTWISNLQICLLN